MPKIFYPIIIVFVAVSCFGQSSAYKFDFGAGKAAKGYIKVTPETRYSKQTDYGFDFDSEVEAITRGDKGGNADFITGSKPFYFSVKLPEGNYDVKLVFGDKSGTSATTVRAECRRLMLENIKTKQGETVEQVFTVHLRDSLIRNEEGDVTDGLKLKKREGNHLHWDNVLTLEFTDSLPKVCSVEIIPNKTASTIFLAGDSTVTDQPGHPYASWGQMFPVFLQAHNVAVANYAESGETMLAFERENRLKKIWSMAKPGDYLFMEFTHNDQKPGGNHLEPYTTFKDKLKEWINEARKRKITPVLVTSTNRRNFDAEGHIVNTLLEYPEAMRQTAKEENVALIDLTAMSKTFYEALGEKESMKALVHFPANTFPNQEKELQDNTHFSPYGAYELAECVVSSIRKQKLPMAKFIRKDVKEFNPATPLPFARFYWPSSSFTNTRKPDGN